MGEVWAAVPPIAPGPSGPVALKVVRPGLATQPALVALFLDEARLALQLRHPNIVRAHELRRYRGRHCLIMELIDGVDARRLLDAMRLAGRRLPMAVALHIAACVLRALDHAHTASDSHGRPMGIVHRDVSPPNVMVTRAGEVLLGDFGVAHACGQLHVSETGSCRGTMAYMAPEQRTGEPVDARADLYSVGLLVHELTTGSLPTGPESAADTVPSRSPSAHVEPVPAADLPAHLTAIVERALRADRSLRYPDAHTMLWEVAAHAGDPGRAAAWLAALVAELDIVDPERSEHDEDERPGPRANERLRDEDATATAVERPLRARTSP
jgi:serine/threonine protein kinase